MKVLFLDFDGVLVTARAQWSAKGGGGRFTEFDPVAIQFLNRLTELVDMKVVVSSVWRYGRTPAELQELLSQAGFEGTVIDKTPRIGRDINGEGVRGDEIKHWLGQHPEVTKYCIIDDDSDMLPEQLRNFVKTDSMWGMSLENFFLAGVILGYEGWKYWNDDLENLREATYLKYKDQEL